MNLQQDSALALRLIQLALHGNHSLLHNICGSSLNRGVDSGTLRKAAQIEITAADFRQIASAPHQRADIALLTCLGYNIFHIFFYTCIAFKVAVNIACCLLAADIQLLGQAKIADTVNNTEVNSLRTAAHLGRYFFKRHTENLGSCAGMDILTMTEGLQKQLILRNASQNTQLNLRIIAAHQQIIACSRNKNTANLSALLRACRNVLQVGVRAGQTACYRYSLLEVRMNASRFGINQRLQSFQIGGLQLRQLAMLQNGSNQRMLALQCFQYLGIGRIACFRLFDYRQLQAFKQNHAQLLGRFQVKLFARLLLCQSLQLCNTVPHIFVQLQQKLLVRRNTGKFHLRQHRCQRQLKFLVQLELLLLSQQSAQLRCELLQIFARRCQYSRQIATAQILQTVGAVAAVGNIACQRYIINYSLHLHLAAQAAFIKLLAVNSYLFAVCVCQPAVKFIPTAALRVQHINFIINQNFGTAEIQLRQLSCYLRMHCHRLLCLGQGSKKLLRQLRRIYSNLRQAFLLNSFTEKVKAVPRTAEYRGKALIHIAELQILQQGACLLLQRLQLVILHSGINRCLRADCCQLLRQ